MEVDQLAKATNAQQQMQLEQFAPRILIVQLSHIALTMELLKNAQQSSLQEPLVLLWDLYPLLLLNVDMEGIA